jgi:hypothetical protein
MGWLYDAAPRRAVRRTPTSGGIELIGKRIAVKAGLTTVVAAFVTAGACVGSAQATMATSWPTPLAQGADVTPNGWIFDGAEDAVAGTPPSFGSGECISTTGGEACFQKHGDKIWVKDTQSDGYPAIGSYENYLWDGSSWQPYRTGDCYNRLTAGHWGYCNKDFYEDSTNPNAFGSQGSGIRLYVCGDGSCPDNYVWIRNNA